MDSTQLSKLVGALDRITEIITSSGGLSSKVPYIGADQSVNLNSQTLTSGAITTSGDLTLSIVGNKIFIKEGTGGSVGQATLIAGTLAITIAGLTTSSRAFVTLVTANTTTLTTTYQAVCTANTLTLRANVAAGTINIADVSTLNYFIIQPAT